MFERSQRRAGRRGSGVAAGLGLGLGLGGLVGCFAPDFLVYAPCVSADACAEAGLLGCLKPAEASGLRGLCTRACEDDEGCPGAIEGDADGRCATVGERKLCVLSCMDGETCPSGHVCAEVGGIDDGVARLCFPEAAP